MQRAMEQDFAVSREGAECSGRQIPSTAVVIPAHQAAHQIGACLAGLFAAGFAPGEVVVVDDGSTDGTGDVARGAGAAVLRNETPVGPAEARNKGVRLADKEIIIFCDADVVVSLESRDRLLAQFRHEADLSAVFGSYDDAPPAPRMVSRYRNLLHHFVHQHAHADASTFWSGFGAVRRADFLRLCGFNATWQKIEDVEFGLRLKRAGGRIRLDRGLLCTHLKEWTLGSMLHTDWKGRAVPWTRLILFRSAPRDDLNLSLPHRISAASVAALPPFLFAAAFDARALFGAALAATVFVVANHKFLAFLAAREGLPFMSCSVVYHMLHHAAALLGFGQVLLTEAPRRVFAQSGRRDDEQSGSGAGGPAGPAGLSSGSGPTSAADPSAGESGSGSSPPF